MSESVIGSTGPSRRTLVKAAAWSVPIIAAAVATPLAAAAVPPVLQAEFIALSADTTPNTYTSGQWQQGNPNAQGPAMYAGESATQIGTIQNVGTGAGTLAGTVHWSPPRSSRHHRRTGWSTGQSPRCPRHQLRQGGASSHEPVSHSR